MKYINECIQEINPSDVETIVKKYDVLFNDMVQNTKLPSLENYSSSNATIDIGSTVKCMSSIEEVLSLDNTSCVIKLKDKCKDLLPSSSENYSTNNESIDIDSTIRCMSSVEEISPSDTSKCSETKLKDKCKDLLPSSSENYSTNNESIDIDSTIRRMSTVEEILPSDASICSETKLKDKCEKLFLSNKTNYVIKGSDICQQLSLSNNTSNEVKFKNNSVYVNHINESKIDDKFVQNNISVETKSSLNNAFIDCMGEIHSNLSISDDIFKKLIKTNENVRIPIIHSNLHNHKRKASVISDSCISRIESDTSYFNTFKKIYPIDESKNSDNLSKPRPKSREEIAVGIPNIFADRSSEVEHFKITLERFLQKGICLSLPPTINKCIECRVYQMKTNLTKRDYDSITCRFYAFRQLKFTKNGNLAVAGYPDPNKNIQSMDMGMWLPGQYSSTPSDFNIEVSRKILEDVGGQFCKFVQDEREALKLNWSSQQHKRKIVWKKCVNGIRELCDVCKTTIFNHHWSCGKCGFVVCVDCYKSKLEGKQPRSTIKNQFNKKIWLLCSDQKDHEVDQLSITQILAGDALNFISKLMHKVCISHNILLDCKCARKLKNYKLSISTDTIADVFLSDNHRKNANKDNDNENTKFNILLKKKLCEYRRSTKVTDKCKSNEKSKSILSRKNFKEKKCCSIKYVKRKKAFAPQMSLLFDNKLSSSCMWLCEGNLLFLLDPSDNNNYKLFQKQWKRGQPVMVKNVGNNLSSLLWHPEAFSRDFGSYTNDLINCTTGKIISDQPMCKFWDGFENAAERLYDSHGKTMLLKLKDWPPSADFAETLPDRFQDLMKCLPLKEYTHRTGRFNLASRLPKCFVPPDLGPKMYTAYGNAGTKHKKIGTTNLHLDISDAVNVMVHVAVTKNCQDLGFNWHVNKALQVIEEAGCDDLTKRRIYMYGEIPGALWHIYHASDADTIRDLLIKVSVEHGTPLEQCSDPIHDQSHYLDDNLRERLFKEYGVKGYTIVQFYGDAIFIPAGAPHQVRNLHNCIKVAEDFVSPENVHHSFRMTQEFRNLTDSHTNHEDKLQIKNIVFHAVKDSISVLMHSQNKYV